MNSVGRKRWIIVGAVRCVREDESTRNGSSRGDRFPIGIGGRGVGRDRAARVGGKGMRIPLIRSESDRTPLSWWEWLFLPAYAVWVLVIMAAGLAFELAVLPYVLLYPERRAYDLDFGTERQRELMFRFRRRAARVSVWRRLGRVLTLYRCRRILIPLIRRRRSRGAEARRR